ncbi:MAG: dihydroorotate dehydrogenase [Planctomycetota bacterium]
MSRLSSIVAGLTLRTPLISAAGTAGYIREIADVVSPELLGAITTKSITREPREGNPPWRLIDIPRGMLNAIGLANVGLDAFLRDKLPEAANTGTTVIGSIAGHSVSEYVEVARAFDASADLPAVELNVSCPNTADGLQFGESPTALRELLNEVRPVLSSTRMIVKLSPNVGDVVAMADAAIDGGADALTLINTVTAMSIDVDTRRLRLSRGRGGLSGPSVHPIAVRMVYDVYHGVARDAGVPIIGLGGVLGWDDAAEFILAGASAVGVGTALFVDPRLIKRIVNGLDAWVERQGCANITELIGQATMPGASSS